MEIAHDASRLGLLLLALALASGNAVAEGAGFDEEIVVVAPTPLGNSRQGIPPERLPFVVQGTDADAIMRSQSLDLTEQLNQNFGSVTLNSAQGNPLQPDLQYRGYTASPLLGLPMGISVYQNGVRINEPLGDAVNWDLIPASAIHHVSLVGGADPLFGLNTLGGALSIELKNGFSYQGRELEVAGGSWDRVTTSLQSGGNNGTFGYYLNVSSFDEAGWRRDSPSDSLNVVGVGSWRGADSSLDLTLQYGDSKLIGNGPAPQGLLARNRQEIFTAPDITGNDMQAATLAFSHAFTEVVEFVGNGFYRHNDTHSFNGDASPFQACALGNGDFLLDELDAPGLDALGLDAAGVCGRNVLGVANPKALETALNGLAGSADAFNLNDLTPDLTGTRAISDEGIDNRSRRQQESWGTDLQWVLTPRMFERESHLVAGFNYLAGRSAFSSVVELSGLDPRTRSTEGLGLGSFLASQATRIRTANDTWSLYFLDNLPLTERFTLSAGGRYNHTAMQLRDQSGLRPELNGDHLFERFNPTVGGTYEFSEALNLYASYSESARAPTAIELSCNEGVFEIARALAVKRGEDPNDIEVECRLPNAFLADPPLAQVVARSVDAGVRGVWHEVEHRLGYFRTLNEDDIIFQSTGRSTGLFANVDATRREGMELALAGNLHGVDWSAAYSFVDATYGSTFKVLSPNHPRADANGEVTVSAGSRIPGVPQHQLKFGADYRFARGFGVGADLMMNSDQFLRGDEANALAPVAAYASVNVRGNYTVNPHVEVFARVINLFDTDYENYGLLGEDPTGVIPTLTDASPRFLGAGGPRAGWLGLRFRL